MDGRSRNQRVLAGAAVVATVALAVVLLGQWEAANGGPRAVASVRPSERVHVAPRPPVLATLPTVTPPPSPSPSPSPSNDAVAASDWSQTFVSPLFRYSIRYPVGWLSEHSVNKREADTFTFGSTGTRLSILRRSRTPGVAFEDQVKSWLPPRHQSTGGCYWNGGGLIYIAGGDVFHEDSIDGHPALIRSECSVVDAAVDLGDEAMLLVLRSARHMATGDRATFDDFATTMAITVSRDGPIATPHPQRSRPPATPEPTQAAMFVSPRFGYAIAYPADWKVDEVTGVLDRDELNGPMAQRMTIRTVPKPRSVSARSWAAANLATRVTMSDPQSTGCRWSSKTVFIPRQPAPLEDVTIAGKKAVVRSECSYVDGVVDLGDRVLLLSLSFTAHRAEGDRATFDGLVTGLRILSQR